MKHAINIWIPFLPPSSNSIYISHPGGKGRVLSDKARQFKVKAMQTIQKNGRVAFVHLQRNTTYELRITVFFKQVIQKGYPKTTHNKFTRIDLSNRIKLIEDTVAEAVALDDSHNFRLVLEKQCDPEHPGLYVVLTEIPETEVGLTKETYDAIQLRQSKRVRTSKAGTPDWFR